MGDMVADSGTEAAEKFALALAASLILHFALMFGLQIRAPTASSQPDSVIQARLVEAPISAVLPPQELEKMSEPEQIPALVPPPDSVATAPSSTEPSASAATPESSVSLPVIEVPMIEDTTYYPAKEVDVHPSSLQIIRPNYPDEAVSANTTGSVVLVLMLDESGKVQDISVEEAVPSGVFDKSALEAFRNARFSPAQRNGRVVKSQMRIKVSYELNDIDSARKK